MRQSSRRAGTVEVPCPELRRAVRPSRRTIPNKACIAFCLFRNAAGLTARHTSAFFIRALQQCCHNTRIMAALEMRRTWRVSPDVSHE